MTSVTRDAKGTTTIGSRASNAAGETVCVSADGVGFKVQLGSKKVMENRADKRVSEDE